jgi:hypothetical protein
MRRFARRSPQTRLDLMSPLARRIGTMFPARTHPFVRLSHRNLPAKRNPPVRELRVQKRRDRTGPISFLPRAIRTPLLVRNIPW